MTDYVRGASGTEQYHPLARRSRDAVTRHRLGRAADTAREHAETILGASPNATFVSIDGRCVYANDHAIDLLSPLIEADVIDTPISTYLHRTDGEEAMQPVEGGDGPIEREQLVVEVRGDTTPVEGTVRQITWDGSPAIVYVLSELSERIERAHDRMFDLIEDILTLSKEGEVVGGITAVDLPAKVEASWRNVATGDATLTIETERCIEADGSRAKQLLENLLRNAVEHGGEDVTIRVGDLSNGFYVEDDGVGIPEDARQKLFEGGYTTNEDGTGIGLRVAEQIAVGHGWEITATSSEGGGARFEITGVEAPKKTPPAE